MKKATSTTLIVLSVIASFLVMMQIVDAAPLQVGFASGAPTSPEPTPTPAVSQMWNKIYSGGAQDAAWSVIQTLDGGYALACNMWSFVTGGLDVWLIKTDARGDIQWNKTYGGSQWDGANSLVATSDGGFAIAGSTGSFGAGGMDCWLIKTDAYGTMLWNQTYGSAGSEYGRAVIETPDGGFAIAGHAFSSVAEGRENYWLVKTDALGKVQWSQTYGGAQVDWAYSIVNAPDGGYAIAGYTSSFGGNSCLLVKTDTLGNMQWNKTYAARGAFGSRSLVATADGGYALTGIAYNPSLSDNDFWLAKIDAYGNMQWNQTYQGPEMEHAYALVAASDGGYAIAGFTTTTNVEEADFLLVKTDAFGIMQWNKTYGGPYADAAYTMIQTTDGGYALAGSWSYLVNKCLGGSVWLIKTDSEGNTTDLPIYPNPTSTPTPTTSPTTSPTSTPKPTPTPISTPGIFQTLTQTPTPSTLPTPPPSTAPAPTATSTPTPPTPTATLQPMPKLGATPSETKRLEWVPIAITVVAVVSIGIAVCAFRKLKA